MTVASNASPIDTLVESGGLSRIDAERLGEVGAELARRRMEALNLYEGLPQQENFHASLASQRIVRGGNRCQPAETVVWRADGTPTTLGDVQVGDRIWGVSRKKERHDRQPVEVLDRRSFREETLRLVTKRGYVTEGTHDHLVWACPPAPPRYHNGVDPDFKQAGWVNLQDLQPDWYVRMAFGPPGFRLWWDRVLVVEKGLEKEIVGITTDKETYIGDGVVSHNSGKSLAAFIETARAATGRDPYGKYPTDRPLRIWIICYEEGQIGRTAYRLLFKPGAFKIIRDLQTGHWRSWRPWDRWDAAREHETQPAPPLIPPRMAPETAFGWKDKARRIFNICRLVFPPGHPMDGTELHAFPSGGEPPMGDPVDVIHIDEDLKYARHIPEFEARLSDNRGRLFWSVFPYTANDALVRMSKRAEEQNDLEFPDVEEFRLTFSDNPFIDPDEKRKRLSGWTEVERLARDLGEFLLDAVRMYPRFHVDIHGIPRKTETGKLEAALELKQIPAHWTRYMSVDPGTVVTAVLFAAVPPPEEFGDAVVCYDELYLKRADAVVFAEAVAKKVEGQQFRAFIIDDHGSRSQEAGSGLSVRHQYTDELRKRDIRSETTGNGFYKGSDDWAGRAMEVRRWLQADQYGHTRFRLMRDALPNMVSEFAQYQMRIVRGGEEPTSERPVPGHDHLMNALEYLAAYNPRYTPPRKAPRETPPIVADFRRLLKEIEHRQGMTDAVQLAAAGGRGF